MVDPKKLQMASLIIPKLEGELPALHAFVEAGGMVKYISPSQGYRARLHGITATGTAGAHEAVRNWIAQVKRKAELLA